MNKKIIDIKMEHPLNIKLIFPVILNFFFKHITLNINPVIPMAIPIIAKNLINSIKQIISDTRLNTNVILHNLLFNSSFIILI